MIQKHLWEVWASLTLAWHAWPYPTENISIKGSFLWKLSLCKRSKTLINWFLRSWISKKPRSLRLSRQSRFCNFDEFCNLFDLTILIKTEICWTKNHKSTIDLFLTNWPLSFKKTRATETGISDYHNFISTF